MNPEKEDIKLIVKKFKWVDNKTLSIINNEGIEKLISFKDGIHEISTATIPFIDLEFLKNDNKSHYYFSYKVFDKS